MLFRRYYADQLGDLESAIPLGEWRDLQQYRCHSESVSNTFPNYGNAAVCGE